MLALLPNSALSVSLQFYNDSFINPPYRLHTRLKLNINPNYLRFQPFDDIKRGIQSLDKVFNCCKNKFDPFALALLDQEK